MCHFYFTFCFHSAYLKRSSRTEISNLNESSRFVYLNIVYFKFLFHVLFINVVKILILILRVSI